MPFWAWVLVGLGGFCALVTVAAVAFLIYAGDTSEDWH